MLLDRFIRIIKSNLLSGEQQAPRPEETGYTHSQTHSGNSQQTYTNTNASSTNTQETKYYQALEIRPGASFDEIKAAYKKLVKKYHPDLFHNNPEKRRYAEIVTGQLNEAYAYFEQKFMHHKS
jgi:DnaJ-domain-containing protein 1